MHTQYTHTHTFRVMLINPGQLDTTCPGFKLGIAWEKVRTRKDAATISATNSWCTALMPSREFNLSLLILSNNCWIPDARTTLRHARWWISIIALVKRLCNCSIGQKVALVKGSAIALVKRLCNCIGQKVVRLQHWSKVALVKGCAIAAPQKKGACTINVSLVLHVIRFLLFQGLRLKLTVNALPQPHFTSTSNAS